MSFDNVCKFLAEQNPQPFVKWLLGIEGEPIRVLKTELNVQPIRADAILFLRVGKQILHLEFQTETQSKPSLPLRMLDYYVRLKRKYNCPIIQIIIFLQQTNSEIVFQDEYRDDHTIHKYRIIRLWEEESSYFLEQPILYPFAVLTKSNSPDVLLGEIANKINAMTNYKLQPELMACSYILAGLKLEARLIKALLKEEIMKGSVTYQELVRDAQIQGKIEGKIEGKREEAFNLIEKIIQQNIGETDPNLLHQIECLSLEKMEELTLALFKIDCLGDLELWLEDNT